jgi:hypothetical protein
VKNERAEAVLIVIKRIAKWVLLSVLGLAALALFVWLGVYLYNKWESRPKVVSELKGIALGEKLNDVLFKNSKLKLISGDIKHKALPDLVLYRNEEDRIGINISDDKVYFVEYKCADKFEYTSINGIKCNDTSGNIKDKYGDKIRVLCHVEIKVGARVYDIVEYGIRYMLVYNGVVGFSIAKPEHLKTFVDINWGYCD